MSRVLEFERSRYKAWFLGAQRIGRRGWWHRFLIWVGAR